MRNPIDQNFPPVTLPEFECGTDDRVLYAAAVVMLAVLVGGTLLVWRWVTPLWGVR